MNHLPIRTLFLLFFIAAFGAPFARGEAAQPPAESATGGQALLADASPDSPQLADDDKVIRSEWDKWREKLAQGGTVVPVLLVLSVVAIAFLLERIFALRRSRFAPKGLAAAANKLWKEGKYDEIIALCEKKRSVLADVIAFVVKHRDAEAGDVVTTAGDIGARHLHRHVLRAYPLAVVATVSPLLGLLGTVSGMIGAFDTVALAGELGNAGALGGDISKALVTTLVGLVVAVPALLAYHYLKARTNLLGLLVEEEMTDLTSEWLMRKEKSDANSQS